MIPDGPAVLEARRRAGLDRYQVARLMRRQGLPGTTAHWLSMLERGMWGDCPERWLRGVAVVLDVDLGTLTVRPCLYLVGGRRDPGRSET